ncbi:MAG TPA: hypothetical protein VEY91_02625 [Candidatus Limnocylindria bacterium]|nr:hypothetical protein [Candidatus Limnocylindria bacterium]
MVPLTSLWLPIVLSAVVVFAVSSLIHMVLGYHKNDYRALPAQDEVQDTLRKFNLPPGDYMLPRAGDMKEMSSPAFIEKMKKGPVMVMTVMPSGSWAMGPQLGQWFLYAVIISAFAAYVTGRTLGHGAEYLSVFRFAGATAFAGYALALPQLSIWYKRSWNTTIKTMFDGLVYSLLTGGVFGWLWPN